MNSIPGNPPSDHDDDVDEWAGAAIELYAIRETLAERFEACNREGMRKVFIEFRILRDALHLTEAVRVEAGDERLAEGLALFNSAWNSLVSAYQIMRQMDEIGACTLMRLALETASSGFAILTSDPHYEKYVAYKFSATKCVSIASKVVPLVGKWYGAYSMLMSHPHRAVHGPFFARWSAVELARQLGQGDHFYVPGGKEPHCQFLAQLALMVCLTTRLLELGFFADVQTRSVLRKAMRCSYYTEDAGNRIATLDREIMAAANASEARSRADAPQDGQTGGTDA